ncbi:MAG: DUF3422 domain-containing protein [Pseudomonadota bacterium]
MTQENSGSSGWNFHPARQQLIAEAHARPSQNISGPAQILHIAFRSDDAVYKKFFEILEINKNQAEARHLVGKINGICIKLERHTEFMSCTAFQDNLDDQSPEDLSAMLSSAFPMDKVEVLVLIRLELLKSQRAMLKEFPFDQRIYGGRLSNGIDVRSTFSPDEFGTIHFVIHSKGLTSDELGRRLQRLIEMETYRTMALLALPKARQVGAELTIMEQELDKLTTKLRNGGQSSQTDDEELFRQLTSLSERTNSLASNTRYRFSASRAYSTLFHQRIMSLSEEKVGDLQTMTGFLRSRLEPAMATMESTAKRQQTLTDDLSRALVLLRTRIELNLNKGNQALLKSMDKRHDQQLKISQTVEGLSIIAITYYAVGLLSYLLKALAKQPWMPLSATMLTAISVPFVLLIVWRTLHRIRLAWEERKG